jgi:class 3 adenylate cyclase
MTSMMDYGVIENKIKDEKGADIFSEKTLRQFAKFILDSPEEELFRTNPLRYAEKTGEDQLTATNLFLYATHAGIYEFSWGTLCPSCGGFVTAESGLRYISSMQHCALCTLPYSTDTDNAVEIAFTVSPKYRPIRFHELEDCDFQEDWMFIMFSTSIALFPEVHQIIHGSFEDCYKIMPNHIELIELELELNHYIFIVPATHGTAHISVSDKNRSHTIDLKLLDDGTILPEMTKLAPGTASIRIHNQTEKPVMVGLHKDPRIAPTPLEDRPSPIAPLYTTSPYLTGKQLITNQTFRNLFEKESVPADEGLEFNDLSFLFTDLKGSTELYDRLGDLEAFSMINRHFDVLRETIAANKGAVVKTMGDAIMASFATPKDAIFAACSMKSRVKDLEGCDGLELKIGIHRGPSMAINTNEQLDFFGQTVNIASRVQNIAEPGQIVITKSMYDSPGVKETIKNAKKKTIEGHREFKGVSGEVTFYCLE